eukprot:scaffold12126_cov60-Phaeocystis_antarctica.AAC.1
MNLAAGTEKRLHTRRDGRFGRFGRFGRLAAGDLGHSDRSGHRLLGLHGRQRAGRADFRGRQRAGRADVGLHAGAAGHGQLLVDGQARVDSSGACCQLGAALRGAQRVDTR